MRNKLKKYFSEYNRKVYTEEEHHQGPKVGFMKKTFNFQESSNSEDDSS